LDAIFPPAVSDQSAVDAALPQVSGYRVECLLGRGGMGAVFRAWHHRLNRPVALKMMLAGAYAGPRERERFQREAEAVAGLQHPNVVQVHDVGDASGRPYFTMELVDGGSLAQTLTGAPLPVERAAELVGILAAAVQAAHTAGVVHRDLKPANVLLTIDGTPKVSDFGLARRLSDAAGLTHTGVALGTPSYMAPEQAGGKLSAVGPAADVYALGAILYECLTGRPPIRAESPQETLRQVIAQDPVPPSRLNSKVPRDLETICLKCLEKDPQKRYPSASDLAADLHRFQRGESIVARRPGLSERFGRWVRRNQKVAALLGASVLLTIALISDAVWLGVQHAQRRQAVEGDLREVTVLQQQARWSDARAALQRAEARLDGSGPRDLRLRLDQARQDLDLVIELDRIRLSRVTSGNVLGNVVSRQSRLTSGNLVFYRTKADQDYTKAFGDSGLAKVDDPPDVVAARINASTVQVALLAALDDWAVCAIDKDRRDWLLAVARKADPDLHGWRDRIRDPAVWEDPEPLAELARTVPESGQPVSLLLALAERLGAAGGDAPAFLKRVLTGHPADFWVNLILGDALLATTPMEAGGYYRAALASRPGAAVAYTALGDALRAQNLQDEAIEYYRRAVAIDPRYARGHTNLGNILNDVGRPYEAVACYRRALEVDPTYAWAHFDLATTLRDAGRMEEALENYRQYHAVDSTHPYVAHLVRAEPVREGRGEEVRQKWKKELEADPPDHDAWFGYAELCLFLGHEDEYRQARQALLRRFGATSDPYVAERTARTILLSPAGGDELQAAVALAERAVAAKATTAQWIYPYFLFAKGLAEYRQDHFDVAISIMRADAGTVMGPAPRLVIAMAQYRNGQQKEARQTLAAEVARYDWGLAYAISRDHWIWHALRREAEAMVLPSFAALLEGKSEPRDNTERLALLGVSRFQNRTRTSARLYADAFVADTTFAADPRSGQHFNAARSAAQVGCGRGTDTAGVEESERVRWRKQAREWLRADLAEWVRVLDKNPAARGDAWKALTLWQVDPDLACVRDPGELNKLPEDERKEFAALWADTAAVLARTKK
jgi:serine/threonine-protein kinase